MFKRFSFRVSLSSALFCIAGPALAGQADVVGVKCSLEAAGTYRFDVTLAHDDAGWDHFADKWQVLGPQGEVLGERVLAHPHDNEQPFTRSQTGIEIPSDIRVLTVHAHDMIHGWGGAEITLTPGQCTAKSG